MYLIAFLCSCLLILSALSILAKQVPELQASVLSYGKLNLNNTKKKPKTIWATFLSKLLVPKYYFSHFYIIGLLFALVCIIELISWDMYQQPLLLIWFLQHYDNNIDHHLDRSTCIVGLTLMTIHLSRRVYESFWIERPSKTATMHLSHYLIGVGFYGAMVFGTWLEGLSSFGSYKEEQQFHMSTFLPAVVLFLYASYHQHKCHVILASLRRKHNRGYTIPRGDWFEYIVAPHYFADILVYLSLNILYAFQNYIMLCGLIWTIINLSITANETQAWYQVHFSTEKYDQAFPHGRWRIIPFCY